MKQRLGFIFYCLTVGIIFLGCSTAPLKKYMPTVATSTQKVQKNDNKYSISLGLLGDMREDIGDPDIYIYIKPIKNKTSIKDKVPNDITGILKSAFLSIGYKIHLVPNLLLLQKETEAYCLEGEISEYDIVNKTNIQINKGLSFFKDKEVVFNNLCQHQAIPKIVS